MERQASAYLSLIALMWGLTFPLVGIVVQKINPSSFVFLRFIVAALCLVPFVYKDISKFTLKNILPSMLIALCIYLAYFFQGLGLQTIGANESVFIISANIAFVPLLSWICRTGKPDKRDILNILICLCGLYILTGANLTAINRGEFYSLLCSIMIALSICLISRRSCSPEQPASNAFILIFFAAIFSAPLGAAHIDWHALLSYNIIFTLFFCALFATNFALYLQFRYQRYVTPIKAALIFCLQPVFGCVFSWLINNEHLTANMIVGGTIILVSMVLPEIIGSRRAALQS